MFYGKFADEVDHPNIDHVEEDYRLSLGLQHQSLPRVVGPYTLSNLCQRLNVLNWFPFHKILPV